MEQQPVTTNHLLGETSPYLRQHMHNPVDWYPWGEEALQKAKRDDKPIFLSIGYSACHWCHVMEKESFVDEGVARFLNQNFISIKVDREERPDLDNIYMTALVLMTGQGGWPMTIFLTPDLKPFFGGTYFPPVPQHSMISFFELLKAIHQAWQQDRTNIVETAKNVTEKLKTDTISRDASSQPLQQNLVETIRDMLVSSVDWQYGGWGRAPKFPQPLLLEFLCRQAWRGHELSYKALVHTLDAMSRGGMYDLVGGGFHRYSTDAQWLSPHFEKMLYDNAQLALVYLHAYLLTHKNEYKQICTQTLDFIVRDMTDPLGGFYSSLDADSDGEEGKYYLWTEAELKTILTENQLNLLKITCPYQNDDNLEVQIIFQRTPSLEKAAKQENLTVDELSSRLDEIFRILRQLRDSRSRPPLDKKILTSWNGLALRAFAEAGRYLDRQDYLEIAQKNASYLLSSLWPSDGLRRSWSEGQPRFAAYLEDYASLILGLIALYQVDFDHHWYASACSLRDEMVERFTDSFGGFFDTQADTIGLLFRPKELQDSATPSGNALAFSAELLLDEYSGATTRAPAIENFIAGFQDILVKYPTSFGCWLQILDFIKGPVVQIASVYPNNLQGSDEIRDYLALKYIPNAVLAASALPIPPEAPELLRDRPVLNNHLTVYVCQDFFCNLPATNIQELIAQLP